jgi:hypothetical protein
MRRLGSHVPPNVIRFVVFSNAMNLECRKMIFWGPLQELDRGNEARL